jgi:hypothetical protein
MIGNSLARGMVIAAGALLALTARGAEPRRDVDPAVPADPLRRAYFGDIHLHTSNSFDAAWAGVRTTPRDAYRYAQGLPVTYMGSEVKRRVPLDFLAVTDHAEYMGVTMQLLNKDSQFEGTNWYETLTTGSKPGFSRIMGSGFRGAEYLPELNTEPVKRDNWQRVLQAANDANRPGKFTAFGAFEWSDTPGGSHNHRVVIFRGPQFPDLPFSALDSRNPEDLWRYADANRARGIDSVLIPHNPNLSNGLQFSLNGPDGGPMTRDYAELKARNEKLVEITQIKGTSETHPDLSPNDEFAGFEIVEHYIGQKRGDVNGSYARQALARGFNIAERTGVNPYRLGFVGSSDYHSATSATEENNDTGALGDSDLPSKENAPHILNDTNAVLRQPTAVLSASGITGVWAEQNTREAIFAALQRREVYATSGTRIQVRMFGGWNYPANLLKRSAWLGEAYKSGVPMGGDLARAPAGARSPRFLVQALKDPDGANLDRIQIIKVWRKDGQDHEQVYDVVWSGNRKADARTGKLPAVGNTVDATKATYQNSIGAAQLSGEWVDPAFDPKLAAAYYARVIEIPTPRWTTYLAVRNNIALTKARDAWLQERAWTSPIFYSP